MPDRRVQADLDAERSVIGALLLSTRALGEVAEILDGADFHTPGHETIYRAVCRIADAGKPVDAVTVAAELDQAGELHRVGGRVYLTELMAGVPTAANAGYYAELVAQRAKLRRLDAAGIRVRQLAATQDGTDADQIIDLAQAELYSLTNRERRAGVPVGEAAEAYLAAAKEGGAPGAVTATGFADLDRLTGGGLRGGQMVIVAARPAVGKSTLALDIARHATVKQGLPAAFFSLEMSTQEIIQRTVSAEAQVLLEHIRDNKLDTDDWTRLAKTLDALKTAPLWVDDTPGLTVMELRSKTRRLAQKNNLGLVVVDYLQLMRSHGKAETRQQEVSELSRSLKLLAKELDVPVIAVSQLNRAAETRQDKRPAMADLRESGSLEQDADIVILLHRPATADPKAAPDAELTLAKHRNGPTGTIPLVFRGHYACFSSLAAGV
jgi:replicative DNA helicase